MNGDEGAVQRCTGYEAEDALVPRRSDKTPGCSIHSRGALCPIAICKTDTCDQGVAATRQQLRDAGYPAEVVAVLDDNRIPFDVGVLGFVSKKDARTFKKKITGRLGVLLNLIQH